jgi:hypothetical protein
MKNKKQYFGNLFEEISNSGLVDYDKLSSFHAKIVNMYIYSSYHDAPLVKSGRLPNLNKDVCFFCSLQYQKLLSKCGLNVR